MYHDYKSRIDRQRATGRSWDEIFAEGDSKEKLKHLAEILCSPLIESPEVWRDLVSDKKKAEEKAEQARLIREKSGDDSIIGTENETDIIVNEKPGSCWASYRTGLEAAGWNEHTIETLKESVVHVLKRMKRDTFRMPPVKGLVVGHVQSGKTANMAGLMAIGADNGYNFFVVLSGTIESLRQQTQSRLYRDLQQNGYDEQHKSWLNLNQPDGADKTLGQRLQDMDFTGQNARPCMTVILKNRARLENLESWLNQNPEKLRGMKMVIIDDEADQAGINNANVNNANVNDDENNVSTINCRIRNLTKTPAWAVNYVSYTATPYANFLNESYPESLYPSDFIAALPQPDRHFGSQQIFGLQERYDPEDENRPDDGLGILREIPVRELNNIREVHENRTGTAPPSLQDALCWFICASACMRYWKMNEPASMLIHTSQLVRHHSAIGRAVEKWFRQNERTLSRLCRDIWNKETKSFPLATFNEQFSTYGRIDQIYGIPVEIRDYPSFEEIEPEIRQLAEHGLKRILLNEEGDLEYSDGIHLCIDNSENNGVDNENQIRKLIYPNNLGRPTSFIVIGGNTLSRGLTIEGLTSTFFLRSSNQMDTLMQMGRWFGYRRGYELLPRIWMSDDCRDKFTYLAYAEKMLREELRGYMEPPEKKPSEFGPRVINHYALSWMRPTARSKMQNAQPTDFNFAAANPQTTLFLADEKTLDNNIRVTEEFFNHLGTSSSHTERSVIWREIDFSKVAQYLQEMSFHPRAKLFGMKDAFIKWFNKLQEEKEQVFNGWNVVAAGISDHNRNGSWNPGGETIGKVSRSKLIRNAETGDIAIGVLRAPGDLFADIETIPDECKERIKDEEKNAMTVRQIQRCRDNAGLGMTPQILVYRINKDSKPEKQLKTREALGASKDLIGISLWIPGEENGDTSYARTLTVRINPPEDSGSDL